MKINLYKTNQELMIKCVIDEYTQKNGKACIKQHINDEITN